MKIISFLLLLVLFSSCSKMEEKKTGENTKAPNQQNTNSANTENKSTSENKSSEKSSEQSKDKSDGKTDEKAVEISAAADKSIKDYESDKSDANKKVLINNCMAAANYLMFEAALPAREKYKPALKYYRMVLTVDPKNDEAIKNKNEIERIYESMGMPVPK